MQKKIKVGSDFSGVGAFNQALIRLGIDYEEVFACDMDKYARETFIHNYGEPEYYPTNVYEREIPKESLDIYMTSPPCQAFSLAGKRLGKNDKRGILFFNSLEFIQKNQPRYFIFENVKGLLSDDGGKTFSEWVNYLGGKSVNGLPVLFPYEDSVSYHLYWKVLNAKNYNIPQNRERVFLIGIRDDNDNKFSFPPEEPLTKRLKDVLEQEVFEKYYLSQKIVDGFMKHNEKHKEKGTGFVFSPKDENQVANCLRANAALCPTDNTLMVVTNGRTEQEKQRRREHFKKTGKDSGSFKDKRWILKNQEYYDTLLANPNPLKEGLIALKSDEQIKVGTWRTHESGKGFREIEDGTCPTIPARAREDGSGQTVIKINSAVKSGYEEATTGDSISLCHPSSETRRGRVGKQVAQTLDTGCNQGVIENLKIRRLTPRECFRLMDFPDSFTWPVSDSQAYKQAGNSIVVNVLYKIIKNLSL